MINQLTLCNTETTSPVYAIWRKIHCKITTHLLKLCGLGKCIKVQKIMKLKTYKLKNFVWTIYMLGHLGQINAFWDSLRPI